MILGIFAPARKYIHNLISETLTNVQVIFVNTLRYSLVTINQVSSIIFQTKNSIIRKVTSAQVVSTIRVRMRYKTNTISSAETVTNTRGKRGKEADVTSSQSVTVGVQKN